MASTQDHCRGPARARTFDRRDFLRLGSLALGGMTLPGILQARAENGNARSDTSVILLYLHGGPSHLETFDLKPSAPSEYRSVFSPIATRTPGMEICELFPRLANISDKFSLIRSVHHRMTSHSDGGIEVLTGKTPTRTDPESRSRGEHPCVGAIASRVRGHGIGGVPPYVAIPNQIYMIGPSYLGLHNGAFNVGNPAVANFQVPNLNLPAGVSTARFEDRRSLQASFDQLRRSLDATGQLEGVDQFRGLAYQMLTGPRVSQAFDLNREPQSVRERYGSSMWGQGCLLARRLAQAGSAVITLYIDTPANGPDYTNWDDHILNAGRPGHFAEYMRRRLPPLDQCLSALIDDIYQRGLNEKIMVVVMGEFGRTPRLSHNAQGTGRDHWPDAMSVLVSGGGLKTGQVVGATNSRGEYPRQRPLTPRDVLATVYDHLGIDHRRAFLDHTGRPHPILADAAPIAELA